MLYALIEHLCLPALCIAELFIEGLVVQVMASHVDSMSHPENVFFATSTADSM